MGPDIQAQGRLNIQSPNFTSQFIKPPIITCSYFKFIKPPIITCSYFKQQTTLHLPFLSVVIVMPKPRSQQISLSDTPNLLSHP
jgi:hypothetical protein